MGQYRSMPLYLHVEIFQNTLYLHDILFIKLFYYVSCLGKKPVYLVLLALFIKREYIGENLENRSSIYITLSGQYSKKQIHHHIHIGSLFYINPIKV